MRADDAPGKDQLHGESNATIKAQDIARPGSSGD